MKKILLSIIALCWTIVAAAQNEIMTVVLQHGNDVSTFTGANAFINANAQAVDGDVITLSAGAYIFLPGPERDGKYGQYKDLSCMAIEGKYSF